MVLPPQAGSRGYPFPLSLPFPNFFPYFPHNLPLFLPHFPIFSPFPFLFPPNHKHLGSASTTSLPRCCCFALRTPLLYFPPVKAGSPQLPLPGLEGCLVVPEGCLSWSQGKSLQHIHGAQG